MNQLGSTDLFLGRTAVLLDWSCRIERQKYDADSYLGFASLTSKPRVPKKSQGVAFIQLGGFMLL